MNGRAQGERMDLLEKVPRAPYPGLRPFLDYEGMLMYGRRSQAGEVVVRLGSAAFVAVIGGSGSGKSSLIRAGVVPHLRQYGIPTVGDVWVPVVVTPGTNAGVSASGEPRQTPITRLAWKFEHALSGEPSARRREDIAALLRRPGGFRQLLDAYGDELVLDGVPPGTACFLFVIDQFEELFDKSNSAVADARHLIERVIDHFHQSRMSTGPGRCFLALTMRSEHLNDCAGYLGLPDAINAGSYLVSRLDETQLREAIEKPANRFLRLRQRQDRKAVLPDAVVFQPAVVARLVADAARIAHDPDHLPLLQHALARAWDEACRREQVGPQGVPAEVRWEDLANSATAGQPHTLNEHNVLRRSLDDWAEHIFARHTPEQQQRIASLLRRLGYRDLDAGTYNQQRMEVDEYEGGRQALWDLVDQGLVGDVNYLFWDDENPERVTLKVSHESFIRGWSRFRRLVDEAAVRLEQFAVLMEACREWVDQGEDDAELLEARQLRRMKDAGVDVALAAAVQGDPEGTREWRQLCRGLRHVSSRENLAELPPARVMDFYKRSTHAREHAQRRSRRLALVLAAAVSFVVTLAFFTSVLQGPALDRAMALLDISGDANRARDPASSHSAAGGAEFDLRALLTIVESFENARDGQGKRALLSNTLLHSAPLSWFELKLGTIPFKASSTVEPMINAKLRATLSKAVWRISPELPKDEAQIIDDSSNPPLAIECGHLKGRLTPVEGGRESDRSRRGIFVTDEDMLDAGGGKYDTRLVFSATLEAPGGCRLGEQLLALPAHRSPALLFDASLSYLLLALGDSDDQSATVSVHRVEWGNPETGERASIRPALTTVIDDAASQSVRAQSRRSMVAPASWRVSGGRAIRIDDRTAWRVVSEQATRLVPDPQPSELKALDPAGKDPVCDAMARYVDAQDKASQSGGFRTQGHRDGDYCLVLSRGVAPVDTAKSEDVPRFRSVDGAAQEREAVFVRSYARPRAQEAEGPGIRSATPIAIIELGNFRPSEEAWYVGAPGKRFAGWIALRREADARNPLRFVGAPWGTDALARLAKKLLEDQHRAAGSAPPPAPSRGG